MNKSEVIFLEQFADPNKTYIPQPKTFDLIDTTYLPDFYCVEDAEYIEVVGSRIQPDKHIQFRVMYPELKLKLVTVPMGKKATVVKRPPRKVILRERLTPECVIPPVTILEASTLLGMSSGWVWQKVASGVIKHIRIGNKIYISVEEINRVNTEGCE
jgi:hypothetical protein